MEGMAVRVARVFPRRTKATPSDPLAFVGGPGLFPPEVDRVHVSVAFTWDRERAEQLAEEWQRVAPVEIGGPAMGTRGEDFIPGRYLRPGYIITSRGCPNHCWFCSAWKRDGIVREVPITDGWNVQDDNLLACSEAHVRAVFAMLSRQPERAEFTGGLEAAKLKTWHIDALAELKPKQVFFAYDTPNDYEPLMEAGRAIAAVWPGSRAHRLRCYVLIGYPRDTFAGAEARLRRALTAGFLPMAMLWRDDFGATQLAWRRFQRTWARPAIIAAERGRRSLWREFEG